MTLVQQHFEALRAREKYAGATLSDVGNGTFILTIAGFPLPPGWNRDRTTVYIVVPVGYPQARPDSFWTEPELRLAAGTMPQNATPAGNLQQGLPNNALWFSWHPNSWSPNRDTLTTYAGMVAGRFEAQR